jgi:hypothetical protein
VIVEYTPREKRMIVAWGLSSAAFGFELWSALLRPRSDGALSPVLQFLGSMLVFASAVVSSGGRR